MTWDAARYFGKVQLYWRRASAMERGSEEFLLTIAFACEFMIRGTLVHLNPALNAAIDLESIRAAGGLEPTKPAKTIDLTQGLESLQRAIPLLTDTEIAALKLLLEARNQELHSDLSAISQLAPKDILPSVYSLFVKAADRAGEDLSALVGEEDANQARDTVAAMSKDRRKRVKGLIAIHKDRFFGLSHEEQLACRAKAEPSFESAVLTSGHHLKREKCPACAQASLVVGVPVGHSPPMLRNDQIIREVRIIPREFSCKACELQIRGLDELMAADFPHEYITLDDVDPIEHFGIDVMDHVDVDQVIREYQEDMYGYQDE